MNNMENKTKDFTKDITPQNEQNYLIAYSTPLAETLTNKISKNRYNDFKLFDYDDVSDKWIYNDGTTVIKEVDKADNIELFNALSPTTDKILWLLLNKLFINFNGEKNIYLNENITDKEMKEKTAIVITLDEYKKLVGIKDNKLARENLTKASNELYNKSITHTFKINTVYEKDGKKKTRREKLTLTFRLLDAKATFKSGTVIYYLSQRATPYLTTYSLKMSETTFKLDIHDYPNSFKIATYLNYLTTMKRYNVTVKNIIANSDLPSYEYVKEKGNRNYKQRIIEPFFATMDYLKMQGLIKQYSLTDSKTGKTYDKIDYYNIPITKFINLVVSFELTEHKNILDTTA